MSRKTSTILTNLCMVEDLENGKVVLSSLFSLDSAYTWFPIVIYLLVLMLTLAIFFLSKGSKKGVDDNEDE